MVKDSSSIPGGVQFIAVQGHQLEYQFLEAPGSGSTTVVFLHEGLGSIALWKDFPQRLADFCGCNALVYSRYGHGRSQRLAESRYPDYMHREALEALPELLKKLNLETTVLFGHSDGASIALIHAAAPNSKVAGVVALAPHVMVEEVTIASIQAARAAYETTALRRRLGRYHLDVDATFWGWNDIWLNPAFRDWKIEALLPEIRCPVLAIQGVGDEYGTMAQLTSIRRYIPNTELLALEDCRHSPHVDQPQAVLGAVKAFLDRCRRRQTPDLLVTKPVHSRQRG